MFQDLIKNEPWALELKEAQIIVSNFLTAYQDYYIAINPSVSYVWNKYQNRNIPVLDLFGFLDRPKDDKSYVLFLDDVYAWLASYFFGSSFNNAAFRLLASGRKRHTSIVESSVRFKDVDPRLRALHTHLFLPKYSEEGKIVSLERYVVDTFEDRKITPDLYFDAEKYFDKYDTEEIIESVYKPQGSHITASAAMTPSTKPSVIKRVWPSLAISPVQRAIPDGSLAWQNGIDVQNEIEQWLSTIYPRPEYRIKNLPGQGRSRQDPDLVVISLADNKPILIVAVKSFTLEKKHRDQNGRWVGNDARAIHREHIMPELSMALKENIPLRLVIVNLKNRKRHWQDIDPIKFEHITTGLSSTPDLFNEEDLVQQLDLSAYHPKIVNAFHAKINDPRLSTKALAQALQIDQTELERGIQDIKMQIGHQTTKVPTESKVSLNISKSLEVSPSISQRTIETAKAFGLGIESSQVFKIYDNLQLEIEKGDVVYVTGDSGSGKSLLLKELKPALEKNFGKVVCEGNPSIQTTQMNDDEIVIEKIGSDFNDAMRILSAAGLSEAFIMMRKYSELSDGQKYRYRIAKTINNREAEVWMFDEFVATLDRDSAKTVAYTLQKVARSLGKTLIVATTHEDLFEDLAPTLFVKKLFGPEVRTQRYHFEKRACSLIEKIEITEGMKEEFQKIEQFHYKAQSNPAGLRRIYVAKMNDNIIGGIMYASCNPHLAGRSIAVPEYSKGGSSSESLHLLNRDFLRIARVVVLPKYRGIGLGVKLVKDTMPMTGYPYIETLAVMAKVNPFFEHAGMTRIYTEPPEERDRGYGHVLETLEQMGFDLELITSASYNYQVLQSLSEQERATCQQLLVKHFVSAKYGGTQFKAGIEAGDLEAMAVCLSKARLDMAYLIWKSPDPKFAALPPIRSS
jgi:ABC-type lipoprotein export system ATPase subunit/GNAT superfamily N-acetyltransferase